MNEPLEPRDEWALEIVTDGGPLLIVDRPGFGQWTGDEPFTVLRERRERDPSLAETRLDDRRHVLHFWGNLGGAGEQFVACESEAEASAELARLCAKVRAHVPDAIVREEDDVTVIVDPKSGGELRAELEPRSEYDAAWQSNPDADGWGYAFGKDAHALFWDPRGKSRVDVRVSARGAIILLRFSPSGALSREEEAKEKEAAFALSMGDDHPTARVGEVSIASGRMVVAWAPMTRAMLEAGDSDEDPAAVVGAVGVDGESAPNGSAVLLTRDIYGPKYGVPAVPAPVGAILRVAAGRYVASVAEGSASGQPRWGARWCRLDRM